jgi:hypothetical protein
MSAPLWEAAIREQGQRVLDTRAVDLPKCRGSKAKAHVAPKTSCATPECAARFRSKVGHDRCWRCRLGLKTHLQQAVPPMFTGLPAISELPREYLIACANELVRRRLARKGST